MGQLPLGIALMLLTTVEEEQALVEAQYLLARVQQEITEPQASHAIIDMIATIMVYKFTNLSKPEVLAMIGIELQETRIYREIKEEGQLEGRQQEATNLVLRLLLRRVGELSEDLRGRISHLPLAVLEDLSEALLDFHSLDDLLAWLDVQSGQS